jgi:hypothetical protein
MLRVAVEPLITLLGDTWQLTHGESDSIFQVRELFCPFVSISALIYPILIQEILAIFLPCEFLFMIPFEVLYILNIKFL